MLQGKFFDEQGNYRSTRRRHRREVHRCGDEAEWWSTAGADPAGTRVLWLEMHPLRIRPDGD